MQYFTTQQIGPRRHLTPEGYLLCLDVPIARVGTQEYGPGEVPVPPGPDGIIHIERGEDQVFRLETIASANGKSFVDEHPMVADPMEDGWDVNPENYREFDRGVMLNPRRGEADLADYLVADILVKDAATIQAINDGKVEISCGYNADYETLGPGRGRQHNIIINHGALVPQGRCGPSCSIGDQIMRFQDKLKGGVSSSVMDKALKALDKIKNGFKARDEAMLAEGMGEVRDSIEAAAEGGPDGGGDHHIHIHTNGSEAKDDDPADLGALKEEGDGEADPVAARMDRLEATLAKLVPAIEKLLGGEDVDGDGEVPEDEGEGGDPTEDALPEELTDADAKPPTGVQDRRRARDSAHLQEGFDGVLAKAELLAPGIRLPTFDAKADAARTIDSLCRLRRAALRTAWATDDGRSVINQVYQGDLSKNLGAMDCAKAALVFNGAAALVRSQTNAQLSSHHGTRDNADAKKGPRSLAEINEMNRVTYGQPKRG